MTCPSCGCEHLEPIFYKQTSIMMHRHRGGDSFQHVDYCETFLPIPKLKVKRRELDLYICPKCGTIKGVVHDRETEA